MERDWVQGSQWLWVKGFRGSHRGGGGERLLGKGFRGSQGLWVKEFRRWRVERDSGERGSGVHTEVEGEEGLWVKGSGVHTEVEVKRDSWVKGSGVHTEVEVKRDSEERGSGVHRDSG